MSKIGKRSIGIPSGVEVSIHEGLFTAKGPKGTLMRRIPEFLSVSVTDGAVSVVPADGEAHGEMAARWGLERALLRNVIIGVSAGFEEVLELQGVGYKAAVRGNVLELNLGFSHPVGVLAPEGISFAVEKNIIKVSGSDKELVGCTAANIRALRPPEPYKGSGVRYAGEVIKLKAGKKAVVAGS